MAAVSTGRADAPAVTVFFTAGSGNRRDLDYCPAIRARSGPDLDPTARYSAVLALLCESVLTEQPAAAAPVAADIAARLDMSSRAVDAHIDYLIDKLGIPAPAVRSTGWKRRALIAYVRSDPDLAAVLRTVLCPT